MGPDPDLSRRPAHAGAGRADGDLNPVNTALQCIALFCLAFALRIFTIRYGLPMELDPDERVFTDSAVRMVVLRTLDPDWYGAPASTLMLLLAGAYQIYYIFGDFASYGAFLQSYFSDVTPFFLIGRALSAVIGAACVPVAYLVCRGLGINAFWSVMAGMAIAISPMMIAYSAIVRMDMLQILFTLLFLLVGLRTLSEPNIKRFFSLGLLLGLATTSKYPSIVFIATGLWILYVLRKEYFTPSDRIITYFRTAVVGALVAVFVSGPFIFIKFDATLEHLRHEGRMSHLDATSEGFFHALSKYITIALPSALSWPIVLAGVIGLAAAPLVEKRLRIVLVSFLVYLAFIAMMPLYWERWVLPLVPFCAIGAANLCQRLETVLVAKADRAGVQASRSALAVGAARLLVAGGLIAPVVPSAYGEVSNRFLNRDTRVIALNWIEANVPKGSTILLESSTPALSVDDYDVVVADKGRLVRWEEASRSARPIGYVGNFGSDLNMLSRCQIYREFKEKDIDYLLLAHWEAVFDNLGEAYEGQRRVYDDIHQVSEPVTTVPSEHDLKGPPVHIRGLQESRLHAACGDAAGTE